MYKILFFAKGDRHLASSRVRAYLISDYLREHGHDARVYHVKTRPWWNFSFERLSELLRNMRLLMLLKSEDVLYLQQTIYQVDLVLLILLRRWMFGKRYVFDFVDAIYLEKGHNAFKTRLMIRNAELVVVPNLFLREYALHYNQNVSIIPIPIDTEGTYQPVARSQNERIRIGWTGTQVHYDNLRLVTRALQRLVEEGHSIEFVQVGGGERINRLLTSIKGLKVTFITNLAWDDPRQSASYVQQFDIGITPLQKTEWNRGKDPQKTKEYMACGVATVASAWGENTNIIAEEVNGLLADTEEDWHRALKRLVVDDGYRQKIALAGREYVENTYSYRVVVPRLLGLLEGVRMRTI